MAVAEDELAAMAAEELDAACALPWPDIARVTPWGDNFEGFAPSGRTVEVERRYLWAFDGSGAVIVEVEVRDAALNQGAEVRATLHPPV